MEYKVTMRHTSVIDEKSKEIHTVVTFTNGHVLRWSSQGIKEELHNLEVDAEIEQYIEEKTLQYAQKVRAEASSDGIGGWPYNQVNE